jgi:hypothetical protein
MIKFKSPPFKHELKSKIENVSWSEWSERAPWFGINGIRTSGNHILKSTAKQRYLMRFLCRNIKDVFAPFFFVVPVSIVHSVIDIQHKANIRLQLNRLFSPSKGRSMLFVFRILSSSLISANPSYAIKWHYNVNWMKFIGVFVCWKMNSFWYGKKLITKLESQIQIYSFIFYRIKIIFYENPF